MIIRSKVTEAYRSSACKLVQCHLTFSMIHNWNISSPLVTIKICAALVPAPVYWYNQSLCPAACPPAPPRPPPRPHPTGS